MKHVTNASLIMTIQYSSQLSFRQKLLVMCFSNSSLLFNT